MEHIVDTYKKFHPKLLEICRLGLVFPLNLTSCLSEPLTLNHKISNKFARYAGGIAKPWPLLARKPITEWAKGYVVLIGDAAHPMLPR
jgi:hypothetical protein